MQKNAIEEREPEMKEELSERAVTKRLATKPGCCMWSPILPIDRSADAENALAPTSLVRTDSNEARLGTSSSDASAEVALES